MGALQTFLAQRLAISGLNRSFGFLAGKHMGLSGHRCVRFSFPSLFHRNFLSFSLLFLLTFCSFQFLTPSSLLAAGLKVSTQASEKRGFARLVLNFERLPAYESDVDDTILVFKFKEAVELNLDDLIRKMPNYVSVARVDPDGHAFRLAFSDSFKVNIMEAGSQIFIDILGRQWKGMPPNLPQDVLRAIAKRAAEIEAENQERFKTKEKS